MTVTNLLLFAAVALQGAAVVYIVRTYRTFKDRCLFLLLGTLFLMFVHMLLTIVLPEGLQMLQRRVLHACIALMALLFTMRLCHLISAFKG